MWWLAGLRRVTPALVALGLAACGTSAGTATWSTTTTHGSTTAGPQPHPQAVQPSAGAHAATTAGGDPVGDPTAHAPPLSQVRQELRLEVVYARKTNAHYVDPLQYVNHWERTDQGVDATLPVGAAILAPCHVKVLAIIPNWYAGQPLVYFELLEGPDAGRVQYVAEQITAIARPGSILQQGQAIARYAASGTAIEYGWSTLDGVTLARATTGYEEGEVTPAGVSMRNWLNALGAGAGPS
jgi:hypothetical protein